MVKVIRISLNTDTRSSYVSPDLIEHSPQATSEGATVGFLSQLFPSIDIIIIHQTFENGIGVVHVGATGSGVPNKTAIVDLWRMDQSCTVEHWDVIQTADASTINPIAFW